MEVPAIPEHLIFFRGFPSIQVNATLQHQIRRSLPSNSVFTSHPAIKLYIIQATQMR